MKRSLDSRQHLSLCSRGNVLDHRHRRGSAVQADEIPRWPAVLLHDFAQAQIRVRIRIRYALLQLERDMSCAARNDAVAHVLVDFQHRDGDVDRAYAEVRAMLEAAGRPSGANDLLIAAHAVNEDCILVTNNESEFVRVADLVVENWLAS